MIRYSFFFPTAVFLIRNSAFLKNLPEEYEKDFIDPNPIAPHKLGMLKQMLKNKLVGCLIAWFYSDSCLFVCLYVCRSCLMGKNLMINVSSLKWLNLYFAKQNPTRCWCEQIMVIIFVSVSVFARLRNLSVIHGYARKFTNNYL